MPYKITRLKHGKVRVTGPSGVHAKATTPAKAAAQIRLLNAKEHNPKFKPRSKKKKKSPWPGGIPK
jgi:hypothetical protein